MELTKYQSQMLNGDFGKGKAMAIKILVAIGESFGANRLVPIKRAHISLSAQGADRWFSEKMNKAGATFAVKPTVNPGYSLSYFNNKDILTEDDIDNMQRVHNAYKNMGAIMTYSCTPYLFANVPKYGDIVAFSETSVTIYANSVVGARTNRESSFSSMCSAITGFTPEYGFLLDENRYGDTLVRVEADLESDFDYSILGLICGEKVNGIPIFDGIKKNPSTEAHINLGTNLNVTGSHTIYHILGYTPEAKNLEMAMGNKKIKEEIVITNEDIKDFKDKIKPKEKIDFIMFGCPHYTFEQINNVLEMARSKKPKVPIWILTSQALIKLLEDMDLRKELEAYNISLVPNTCIDEERVWKDLKGKNGLSDSPKCSYYMSTFNVKINVLDAKECMEIASEGGDF
ncbi:aconitase X catalytic domain-containing protein [Peptoniphilus obesi]|uniref:aconitase X catalytic domain-containing protein n=1 Tax=Peptoniphilus obesi TaxID=1472765 RepID=UPI0004AFB132|nr:aconitase X catalytic domain-containing protein [Peptoniphilus obesi]